MSRILVTGAGGFIGSHLVEALVRQGHDVRAFVHYNSFGSCGWLDACDPDVQGQFEVHSGDIRDPNGTRAAVQGKEIVLHLAALIGIPYSYRSPDTYVDTNIRGTLNVLQAARDLGTRQVIHTSTSEVYGSAHFVPITEQHPLQGQSPYAASKIGADQMALAFHRSFGTPVTVIRPFNTYGPRQSIRAVIPTVITQLARTGGRVDLGSVSATRDFSHVADTVAGFAAAMGVEASFGEVVNLGSGFEISVADTVTLIAQYMGLPADIHADDARLRPPLSEVERLRADNSRARELLDWRPKYAELEGFRRGLSQTVDWYVDPANLVRFRTDSYGI